MSIEDTCWKTTLPPWTEKVLKVRGQRGAAPFGEAKSSTQFTSMLMEAVRQGRPTSYIDSLIKAGADVNAIQKNELRWTALMFAAQNGHESVCNQQYCIAYFKVHTSFHIIMIRSPGH